MDLCRSVLRVKENLGYKINIEISLPQMFLRHLVFSWHTSVDVCRGWLLRP